MSKRILVVEDEAVLRMLIVDTLEDEGYEIDTAGDGEEAMTFIVRNRYDLIVLDYMMPRMTGLEVISRVRELPDKKDVKILMLSAKSQQNELELVMSAGANDFLAKPFSPMELIRRAGELIHG